MKLKRLAVGTVLETKDAPKDTVGDGKLEKGALLIHSGPNGTPMQLMSSDGPIEFDDVRIRDVVAKHNAMLTELESQYGGREKTPIGAYPPILDQHSNDSNNRIVGRLNHPAYYDKRTVPKVGENVACAITKVTFIGGETVQKVIDGRIYHLSVGINDVAGEPNYNTLNETSIVIEPAAPGAMLLSKGASLTKKKEGVMPKALKAKQKEQAKRLAAHKARMTKLQAFDTEIKALSAKMTTATETMSTAKHEGTVAKRLHALVAGGRMTPAEYRKLDIKKLSKMTGDSFDTMMETFEAREPQVIPAQTGTSDATEATELARMAETKQGKQLRANVRKTLKKLGAKIKDNPEIDGQESAEEITPEPAPQKVSSPAPVKHLAALGAALESGDMDGAKAAWKQCELGMGTASIEEPAAMGVETMETLSAKVTELSTQLARMAGMFTQLMQDEVDEGKALGEEKPEEEKPSKEGDPSAGDKDLEGKEGKDKEGKDLEDDESDEDDKELEGKDGEKDGEKDLESGDEDDESDKD